MANASVSGRFVVPPAVVYPYYESGRESYGESTVLRVLKTFGGRLTLDDSL